jgi:hypothetical protein
MGIEKTDTWPPQYLRSAFKGKEPSRVRVRKMRNAEQLAAWKAVCKQVDARDGYRCRVCGRRADPNAVGLVDRAHRHHIVYRSAGGEDDEANVITLCAECHAEQHAGRLDVKGNARTGVEVWRQRDGGWYLVAREVRPFQYERD